MSVLSSDPIAQACEPLGKYYEIRSAFTAGGICPNTMVDHVKSIPVLPGVAFERLVGLIDKALRLEAKDYIKRWHTRECEGEAHISVKWTQDMFNRRQKFANVHVNGRKWMSISIREWQIGFEYVNTFE